MKSPCRSTTLCLPLLLCSWALLWPAPLHLLNTWHQKSRDWSGRKSCARHFKPRAIIATLGNLFSYSSSFSTINKRIGCFFNWRVCSLFRTTADKGRRTRGTHKFELLSLSSVLTLGGAEYIQRRVAQHNFPEERQKPHESVYVEKGEGGEERTKRKSLCNFRHWLTVLLYQIELFFCLLKDEMKKKPQNSYAKQWIKYKIPLTPRGGAVFRKTRF